MMSYSTPAGPRTVDPESKRDELARRHHLLLFLFGPLVAPSLLKRIVAHTDTASENVRATSRPLFGGVFFAMPAAFTVMSTDQHPVPDLFVFSVLDWLWGATYAAIGIRASRRPSSPVSAGLV